MEYMNTDQKSLTLTCDLKRSSDLANSIATNIHTPQLIELVGDLGGGKTAFTKALGKSLGVTQTITSPTFNIHRSYKYPNGVLEHFDLYRLSEDEIVQNELLECIEDPQAVVVVEWAGHFKNHLASDRLVIEFNFLSENARKLSISATGAKSNNLLKAIK